MSAAKHLATPLVSKVLSRGDRFVRESEMVTIPRSWRMHLDVSESFNTSRTERKEEMRCLTSIGSSSSRAEEEGIEGLVKLKVSDGSKVVFWGCQYLLLPVSF